MNDKFLIVKYVKEFIFSIDSLVINFPRKEFVIKDRIICDSLDILELIYLANFDVSDKINIKKKILSKLSMLDFYIERSYKNKLITEKVCIKKCRELEKISKLVYGWIKSDNKV